jgi:pimeloyl-ACP methyl ester carboxylesterase
MTAADRRSGIERSMRRRNWLAASFLLIAGCGAAGRNAPPPGSLVDETCKAVPAGDARCATFYVAEDRAKPAGRAIGLRITILPPTADNPAPDPVFYLAGGPGQAASVLLGDPSIVGNSLRERRALVLVDQRGTGGSNGLECPFYGPPGNAQSYFQPFLPIDKVRDCRAALAARADLAQYTTAASVDDLDEVRAALGYETINLIGGSYGTRLAMEYVRRFESRTRTVILEGPVPPSRAMPAGFGRMAHEALDTLLAECASDQACAKAFPRIRDEARTVFDRLRSGPVIATVRHPSLETPSEVKVTRDNLAEGIRYMTYSSRLAARVPMYLHEAFEGNYSPIAQYLMQHRADGTFDGLYLSITCAEDVPFVASSGAEDDEPTYLGGYRVREQRAACAEWPRGAVPPWHRQPVTSLRPVLLVSGALDPVTPPPFGDEVARTLPNSLHLSVPHAGHSVHGLDGLECLSRIKRDFIERATTAGLDTACVSAISRPSFRTTW